MTQPTIGELLRRYRLDASLTQKELANMISCHNSVVSRVEQGQQKPTQDYVTRFIEQLQLPDETRQTIWRIFQGNAEEGVPLGQKIDISPPKPSIYHNLPQSDYGRFIGREAELAKVIRILRPYPHSQMHLVTIDGIGGIGKTALALEVAYRYLYIPEQFSPEERFAAIIWTSAKQTVLKAEGIQHRQQILRNLDDIYTAIAVALKREDITRVRPEEQTEIVRNALIQQRTLLVVDNLETVDDEAVMDFLRELPAPTKAIVTTRHRIDVAYPVRLVGMPWEDAHVLIEQECEKKGVTLDPQNSKRLFDRTGGVPLAIVWSVGLMGLGHGIEMVLRRLAEPNNDIIHFCFDMALDHIRNKSAYELLIALSLFATDASREGLGYIADLAELDRDEGLALLEQLSLVNKTANRFLLLPVTKTFAASELKRSDEYAKHYSRRWVDYLINAHGVRTEQNEVGYLLFFWDKAFYEDGPNVLAAIEWAYEHGTAQDVFTLTLAANEYLDAEGRWDLLLRLCQQALDLARSINNSKAISRLANIMGWFTEQRGDYQKAIALYEEGLVHYRQVNSRAGEGVMLQRLAGPYRKLGDLVKAKTYLDVAMQIAEEFDLGDVKAVINTNYGKLYRDQHAWEISWGYFTKVNEWFEKRVEQTPHDEQLARSMWGHLAIVAYHLGRPQEAKELCQRSLEFFESYGTKGFRATLLYRLALAEEALGEIDAALEHSREATDWFERLGMPDYKEANVLMTRLQNRDLSRG